jgi:ATP-dependent protease ClpP protease subunit
MQSAQARTRVVMIQAHACTSRKHMGVASTGGKGIRFYHNSTGGHICATTAVYQAQQLTDATSSAPAGITGSNTATQYNLFYD